jgi:hypothetical protein
MTSADSHGEGAGSKKATIYVELLDEGVDVWRPVTATPEREGVYRLPDEPPVDEAWAFAPGSLVRCEHRAFADGAGLVAVALAE